jgi:aryl-alcohol dehydrogenase-like predicted oxidoreductase
MPVSRVELAPGYSISRVIKGGWQLAGGHGPADAEAALGDMSAFVDAGVTTFDCADIYTGVEALIGEFLRRLRARAGAAAVSRVQIHTKCVPDLDALPSLTRGGVEAIVDRSLSRLGVERLDLVQLHWWDYRIPGYVAAVGWLDELRVRGKVRCLGLTNFDTARLNEIAVAGAPIVSHQVQYSVLDRRPRVGVASRSAELGVHLLAYGALAGGFLSERWLGRPDPIGALENRSLVKYRLIVEECGGWPALQSMLGTLQGIARKHASTIGSVALRWVLDQPRVAAVIAGARHAAHLASLGAVESLALDEEDRAAIAAVQVSLRGPGGDVYGLERMPGGPHAAVMRYNLNRGG